MGKQTQEGTNIGPTKPTKPTQLLQLTVSGGEGGGHIDVASIFRPPAAPVGARICIPLSTPLNVAVLKSCCCRTTNRHFKQEFQFYKFEMEMEHLDKPATNFFFCHYWLICLLFYLFIIGFVMSSKCQFWPTNIPKPKDIWVAKIYKGEIFCSELFCWLKLTNRLFVSSLQSPASLTCISLCFCQKN